MVDDINQVTTIAEKIVLNEKRVRLHSLQQYFQVDDMKQVFDPIGLRCETLQLEMYDNGFVRVRFSNGIEESIPLMQIEVIPENNTSRNSSTS